MGCLCCREVEFLPGRGTLRTLTGTGTLRVNLRINTTNLDNIELNLFHRARAWEERKELAAAGHSLPVDRQVHTAPISERPLPADFEKK
jgi:hypothetical protein